MEGEARLRSVIGDVRPLDEAAMATARARQARLIKPPGSLGRLEALSIQLAGIAGQPRPRLNRAVAVAMVQGPRAGLDEVAALDGDPRLARTHRLAAVRGHLLERAGDREGAVAHYRRAANKTTSVPERNHLLMHAARLSE